MGEKRCYHCGVVVIGIHEIICRQADDGPSTLEIIETYRGTEKLPPASTDYSENR